MGPVFGYFLNAQKSWLLDKEEFLSDADRVFSGSEVNMTTEGKSYLEAPLGTTSSKESAIAGKVNQWVKEIDQLAEIAHSQPQSAYCALTNGLMSRWNYLMRAVPDLDDKLQPIEQPT